MERERIYGFEMIDPKDIVKIIKKERVWLIDLRSKKNYQKGHIKNARNLPIEYMEEWKQELPGSIGLILYCEHGNQSLLAARKLKGRKGNLYTVVGGYQAYLQEMEKAEYMWGKRD